MSNNTFTSINNPEGSITRMFQNDLEKGGEGSGRKIGKTSSGKDIFSHKKASSYKGWTQDDHEDAADQHYKIYDDSYDPKTKKYSKEGEHHFNMKEDHTEEYNKLDKSEKIDLEKGGATGDIHNDSHAEAAHNLTSGVFGEGKDAESGAKKYHSKEDFAGGKHLVKQGWSAGDSFDWKEENKAEKYKNKMSKTHHVREVNMGDDAIHHLIKPKK